MALVHLPDGSRLHVDAYFQRLLRCSGVQTYPVRLPDDSILTSLREPGPLLASLAGPLLQHAGPILGGYSGLDHEGFLVRSLLAMPDEGAMQVHSGDVSEATISAPSEQAFLVIEGSGRFAVQLSSVGNVLIEVSSGDCIRLSDGVEARFSPGNPAHFRALQFVSQDRPRRPPTSRVARAFQGASRRMN